jgi:hypothetical protein
MIIFNITCHIDRKINQAFVDYVKEIISSAKANDNYYKNIDLLKLLTEIDDQTHTYTLQLNFENKVYYNQFQIEHEEAFLKTLQAKFVGQIFTFTTLLEIM